MKLIIAIIRENQLDQVREGPIDAGIYAHHGEPCVRSRPQQDRRDLLAAG